MELPLKRRWENSLYKEGFPTSFNTSPPFCSLPKILAKERMDQFSFLPSLSLSTFYPISPDISLSTSLSLSLSVSFSPYLSLSLSLSLSLYPSPHLSLSLSSYPSSHISLPPSLSQREHGKLSMPDSPQLAISKGSEGT